MVPILLGFPSVCVLQIKFNPEVIQSFQYYEVLYTCVSIKYFFRAILKIMPSWLCYFISLIFSYMGTEEIITLFNKIGFQTDEILMMKTDKTLHTVFFYFTYVLDVFNVETSTVWSMILLNKVLVFSTLL